MVERYPEAEMVLDDELLFEDTARRAHLARRDEQQPATIVREGEVLAGKYRVERIPGRSGLGVVAQVRHLELGQEVTLKFLVPEACAYPEFVQRFVREARAAVRIQGEHVARVTDVGRLESGAPYMVREYLRGPDLAEVLKVRGPLPVAEAVDYIVQACEGVAEGHALGVVHRNLRPTTLVVTRRTDGTPLVKVVDFAAAESLHVNPFTERAVSLVGTSAIMASLPYLAPEQVRDPHDVDFRADVYSLGVVLYELLTGEPLYSADSAPGLLAMVAADSAPALRALRPDIPGELDHVVLRCLAKNRSIRYACIADLVVALQPFASSEAAASIAHIVRLGQRTSKPPEGTASRAPARLPSSPPAPSAPAATPAGPQHGRFGTLIMPAVQAPSNPPVSRASVHDDVTTINRLSSYGAPVAVRSQPPQSAPPLPPEPPQSWRTEQRPVERQEELPSFYHVSTPRSQPLPLPRQTPPPPPPPARGSVPPPLRSMSYEPAVTVRESTSQPLVTPPPPMMAPPTSPAPAPTAARTSLSGGMARSWAPLEESPPQPFLQRRLFGVVVVAACAALGAIVAFRAGAATGLVQPVIVAPPAAAAPPPVLGPTVTPPAASAPVAAAPAPAAPASSPVAPVMAATAAAPPVVAAPVPAQPAAPVAPAPVAARPAAIMRRAPKPAEEAAPEKPRKPESGDEKVASSKPAGGGDLFDDPR